MIQALVEAKSIETQLLANARELVDATSRENFEGIEIP
jgi:hypothetical protein